MKKNSILSEEIKVNESKIYVQDLDVSSHNSNLKQFNKVKMQIPKISTV